MTKRRCYHELILKLLEYATGGIRKTPLMHKTKISFKLLKGYLTMLETEDLLTVKEELFFTTEKGLHFIEMFQPVHKLISKGGRKKGGLSNQ